MARLFEYQGKYLLKSNGIKVPEGKVAASPAEAGAVARTLEGSVVLKAQAWVTGRAEVGGIHFAGSPEEAEAASVRIFGLELKGFAVDRVLVEEKLAIQREFFVSFLIDDLSRRPMLIFGDIGGSGIEELSRAHPDRVVRFSVRLSRGIREHEARNLLRRLGISGSLQMKLARTIKDLYRVMRRYEARSLEINPLVLTEAGEIYAADCRITVDDNAVHRHPELGIEVAREFDRPATELEKIAYKVEENDYRGTFYFLQMETKPEGPDYIGFHGAGGGGSMLAMDALLRQGFKIPNFCDTSGNPPGSKVYRAARIILSQKNLEGYFYSGSGVASQEQYHTARGLAKAFREIRLPFPAVIRVGGNAEEEAMRLLKLYTKDLPGKVEVYGRDTSADYCAWRLRELIEEARSERSEPAHV